MQELILCRGIPASGKSTFAKAWVDDAPNRVRVNRDDIRFQMYGTYHGENVNEDFVTKAEDALVKAALAAGQSVIVDDTNIAHRYVKRLAAIGYSYGVSVTVKQFDIDLEEAYRRNDLRYRKVPREVIKSMHERLKASGLVTLSWYAYKPYEPPPLLAEAIMVDIDGTLAKMVSRGPYEWARVGEDIPVYPVIAAVEALADYGYNIIVMSGRDGSSKRLTETWLHHHGVLYDHIFMRAAGDMRKDSIVKYELFNEHVRDRFNVRFVLDDRQQVVDMWRQIGLTCFQVAPGEF